MPRKAASELYHINDLPAKRCSKCLEIKLLSQFSPQLYGKFNVSSICKTCVRQRYNSIQGRDNSLRIKYGIDQIDYDRLNTLQQGRCAICNIDALGDLHVDHNHVNGKVRGLLCRGCNVGLGNFFDNPELLRMAARYLERHSS